MGVPPEESTSSTGSSSSTGGADSSSTTAPGSTGAELRLDMAAPDGGSEAGCPKKLDLVFAISASGTMYEVQERLHEAYAGLVAELGTQVPEWDVNVVVASPSETWLLLDCGECLEDCDPEGMPPHCGAELTACDKEVGAGVTFPQGWMASNRRCDFPDGRRYLKGDDPKLAENFACAAQVGLTGGTRSAEAVVQAVSEELNRPGGCNEGFLRDDALLLVAIYHDNYELDSEGTPFEWAESLRAAKHFDDDAFSLLVLTTDVDLGKGGLCWPEEETHPLNPLRVFAQSVKYGRVESICEKSYVSYFAEELAALVSRCTGPAIPE